MTAEPLTLSELPALRALGEKATPGPWRLYNERLRQQFPGRIIEVQCDGDSPVVQWTGFDNSHVPKKQHRANAAFIAAARDALPRACATIEAQAATIAERDAEIARLREALTPSKGTESAYRCEFKFTPPGSSLAVWVPWPVVQEIMAAILARAALAKEPQT